MEPFHELTSLQLRQRPPISLGAPRPQTSSNKTSSISTFGNPNKQKLDVELPFIFTPKSATKFGFKWMIFGKLSQNYPKQLVESLRPLDSPRLAPAEGDAMCGYQRYPFLTNGGFHLLICMTSLEGSCIFCWMIFGRDSRFTELKSDLSDTFLD